MNMHVARMRDRMLLSGSGTWSSRAVQHSPD